MLGYKREKGKGKREKGKGKAPMAESEDARHLLERAEQAAMSGNFASADELLKEAVRIQEHELGPGHPDLANTLTNRAIVAEKTGRAVEAETLYRRAASIAAAALPLNDPMVVESRQNLEDFCRAHGVPIVVPKAVTPTEDIHHEVVAITPEVPPAPPRPAAPSASQSSHSLAWLAAAVVLVAVVLLVWRPWSSPDAATQVNTSEPKAGSPAEPASRPTTAPPDSSANERKEAAKPAVRDRERPSTTPKPPAEGSITLAIAEVCRGFSTNGSKWRCDPVGSSGKAGPLVLYARVKSPRAAAVVT